MTQRSSEADSAAYLDCLRDALVPHLSKVLDTCIVSIIVVAPLFMGGRHPLGRLAFSAICWTAALAWFVIQCLRKQSTWTRSGAEGILLLSIVLVLAQLAPLPPAIHDVLAPTQNQLMPAWQADSAAQAVLGDWSTVTLTPERSRQALCLLLSYSLLFFVACQRLRTLDDIEWLIKWMAIGITAMAALGIVQYFFGDGRFLWIYEHPTRNTRFTLKGAFANQNHFAHFLALGIGPLVWVRDAVHQRVSNSLSQRHSIPQFGRSMRSTTYERITPIALNLAIGGVLVAGVMTFSRGGWLILAAASLSCIIAFAAYGLVDKKTVAFIGVILAVTTVVIAIQGRERLQARIESLATTSIEELDSARARRKIWSAVATAIPQFSRLGAGVGAHREVYPVYMQEKADSEYSHAESGYLQILLETGVPGFLLLLAGLGLSGYWITMSIRRAATRRTKVIAAVLMAAWAASVLHSIFDFVWYIPACMSCTLLLIAAANRLYRIVTSDTNKTTECVASQNQWCAYTIVVAVIGVSCLRLQAEPARASKYWNAYLTRSFAIQEAAISPQPKQGNRLADKFSPHQLKTMAVNLQHVIERHPRNARAHLRLATTYLRQFEIEQLASDSPMGLSAIREASIASQFPSQDAQRKWLKLATGENLRLLDAALGHAKKAVKLSPMLAKAYLHLADLAFLDGFSKSRQAMLAQALRARPYDGTVLFAMGSEALAKGEAEKASDFWQSAFRRDREVQDTVISAIAPSISARAFVQVFEPDEQGLESLFSYYRSAGDTNSADYVGELYARELERQTANLNRRDAARAWSEIERVYGLLQQVPNALTAAKNSVAADPSAYQARYVLAVRLEQSGLHDEAIEQYRWCRRRRPNDKRLTSKLADLSRHHELR